MAFSFDNSDLAFLKTRSTVSKGWHVKFGSAALTDSDAIS
jgi:hypothetical protein